MRTVVASPPCARSLHQADVVMWSENGHRGYLCRHCLYWTAEITALGEVRTFVHTAPVGEERWPEPPAQCARRVEHLMEADLARGIL